MGLIIVIAVVAVVAVVVLVAIQSTTESEKDSVNDENKEDTVENERKWEDLNEETKFVCEGGKVQCEFCNPPIAGFTVTSTLVMLQDQPYVTTGDKDGKTNFNFTGVCTHPSQQKPFCPPPPCKSVINLGEWKDYSDTKIDDNHALLVKSTIPCLVSGQDLKIVDSGQKTVLSDVKPNVKEVISAVIIGRVKRGNPYVSKDATDAGLPDSVPLNKTYEVEIEVKGTGTVNLAIINSNGDNGDATISPTSITATTKVTITGTAKTKPENAGKLKIEAKVDGKVRGTSQGFSVCCHPINYTDAYDSDVYTPTRLGVVVQDGWESDNGVFADLDDTLISEVVDYVGQNDSPPFPVRNAVDANNSGYLPGNSLTTDTHSMNRTTLNLTKKGISEAIQLCIYKCNCCGAVDIVLPNSGFKRIHEVFQVGAQWRHRTRKIGYPVTIGAYITSAGSANVTSPDHNLP